MKVSFFIDRPVFSAVISILIIVIVYHRSSRCYPLTNIRRLTLPVENQRILSGASN